MLAIFKLYNWGSVRNAQTDENLTPGKKYIVQNNFGQFLAELAEMKEEKGKEKKDLQISEEKPAAQGFTEDYLEVIRVASDSDLRKSQSLEQDNQEVLGVCREKIKQYSLPMKLVGLTYSLDGRSLIVAFISESRVDFRELVRDLARTFQKTVRLEQIGSRDEARIRGGHGTCGRELCCIKFNGPLQSINTEMARVQQITHRGSERISGCCGRLLCCLAYELESYEKVMKDLPPVGTRVIAGGKEGRIRTLKVLQKKALIEFEEEKKNGFGNGRRDRGRDNGRSRGRDGRDNNKQGNGNGAERTEREPRKEQKWFNLDELKILR